MENGDSAKQEAIAAEGAVILGQGAIDALRKALFSIGASCGECGLPTYVVYPSGGVAPTFEYALATATVEEGRPKLTISRAYACARPECEGREKFSNHRDVVATREIPSWIPMNGPEPDVLDVSSAEVPE